MEDRKNAFMLMIEHISSIMDQRYEEALKRDSRWAILTTPIQWLDEDERIELSEYQKSYMVLTQYWRSKQAAAERVKAKRQRRLQAKRSSDMAQLGKTPLNPA